MQPAPAQKWPGVEAMAWEVMATRRLLWPGSLGIVCGLAAFLAGAVGWLSGLDARAYDLALRTRPPLPGPGDIVVVVIDDESIARLGRWPWPWSRHAALVRALHEHYLAKAIVFDLLFLEPDSTEQEAEFAQAIEGAGNVYLASFFSRLPQDAGTKTAGEAPWVRGEYVGQQAWHGMSFASRHPPAGRLAAVAAGVGPVNVVPELDGCIRRLPLILDHDGVPYLSLMGAVFNGLVNPDRGGVRVELGEAVDLGGRRVPIDQWGETLISYTGASSDQSRGAFPHYRYDAVLSRSIDPSSLRDKVVLVGFAATGMPDIYPTPITPAAFGVDINAYALNGLLQGRFLRAAGWAARLALTLALAVLASLVAGVWSPTRALGITLILMIWGVCFALLILWTRGVWLGAAPPGLAILGAYTLTVAQRYRESERESLRMEARVDTLSQATRVIASARLRSELLSEVRLQINDAMGARQTNLYLADDAREKFELAVSSAEDRETVAYEMGEGTVGWVAEHGMGHLVRDVGTRSAAAQELGRSVRFVVGSVCYAPMEHRGQVMGVVEAVREVRDAPFEDAHLGVLRALASEAAVALQNVSLYEQLEGKVEIANRQLVAAYAELREERDRVAAIVSNMADGVLLTDAEKNVLFVNPAAVSMFGAEPAEVEGKPVAEVLSYPTLLEQLEEDPPEPTTVMPRIHIGQPRRVVVAPRTVQLVDEEGRRTGAITVLTDITLLEDLSEMKSEFVSLVSHELRTPLTSIMGFAQTLHADAGRLPAAEQQDFLGIIEQESNRLLVMINDLLDVSRMEAGRPLAMRYTELNLKELAEHVVRFQRVTTDRHEFRLEFPEGGLSVEGDRDKVEQMLTNLVSNAIKYSPQGGDVIIGGREQGEEVVVSVRDRGVGMTEEEMGRLFQPYQRVDRDAIKGIRGTGLGLYLVRGLVEAHSGRIWAESQPGTGSTFYFSLPKRRAERETAV